MVVSTGLTCFPGGGDGGGPVVGGTLAVGDGPAEVVGGAPPEVVGGTCALVVGLPEGVVVVGELGTGDTVAVVGVPVGVLTVGVGDVGVGLEGTTTVNVNE
ncbi:hypothetical protein [Kribbella sp. NBC_00889]|uniref:hypothetical protein n=1 Tax=Kribbella sp. NBC_00889 TaxID=2975974 RepID=UPI00386AA470|nr:hypothetical protein OG817_11850 [Kribbella sp. NBC_00889]